MRLTVNFKLTMYNLVSRQLYPVVSKTSIVKRTSVLDLLIVGPKFTRPDCRSMATAIDRYLLRPELDLSSKPSAAAAAAAGTDRQTDGRTDGHSIVL